MMTLAQSGIAVFFPKIYDIVWSLVILVVVALFFYRCFLPKFNAVFDERAARIDGGMRKAAQAQADAEQAKATYEAQLDTARVQASRIRDEAQAEAVRIVADARSRAQSDADQVAANAQRSIESQRRQALVSLQGEVGELATALAGKILGSKLEDDAAQASMIDRLLDDMTASRAHGENRR